MNLSTYQRAFASLRMNRVGQRTSPHKVALLLAVMDLIESGDITDNQIYFDERLRSAFSQRFNELATSADRDRPFLPFFHLRSEPFWHHKVRHSAKVDYDALTTIPNAATLEKTVAYAYLDDALFEMLTFDVARKLLTQSLLQNLSDNDIQSITRVSGWSWFECEVLVANYFEMLAEELAGRPFNKTAYREALAKQIPQRSKGSIEFNHQSVSAILVELGQPYISGYKPRFNYQAQLVAVVKSYLLANNRVIDEQIDTLSDLPPITASVDWGSVLDAEIPERIMEVRERHHSYTARRTNYAEREAANRQVGRLGEEFALNFERYRLGAELRADLADRVEWSSDVHGDGLGYDIRSFDAQTGDARYIEVKATKAGKYLPFYVSENELAFSRENSRNYFLYRVFDFSRAPRLFSLAGAIDRHVNLEPMTYRAGFR